ncbi:hypothetical protein LTR16_000094 [Cryomyces antarcticus]|uniref:BTB domain-containing protein n=1 Tax=Cryomyces antarcticus TaxID=329879 RepID=A0ABR0KUW7_9PEZI|nr:hypothetical protein LTR39_001992 [Cryomyces antarcticus]KAK5132068.1 hypothetical protein LTR16_000094 [Cryomyces antarcticus]
MTGKRRSGATTALALDPRPHAFGGIAEQGLTLVDSDGDLILEVEEPPGKEQGREYCEYRVNSNSLRQSSSYFETLLHPDKFGEGATVAAKHDSVRSEYASISDVPAQKLPHIRLTDIGSVSRITTVKHIMADFLRALHGLDLSTGSPPLSNLANLAIVADRFDALPYFTQYVRRKKFIKALDGKANNKAGSLSEERMRQRVMIGIMLDYPPWAITYSERLIVRGSVRWKTEAPSDIAAALWWDLPSRVEELFGTQHWRQLRTLDCELQSRLYIRDTAVDEHADELIYRRECILETIDSLQSRFLALYTSRERQCKLGYDTSAQCDSFQLGEMLRFFTRQGTIRLQGTIFDTSEAPEPYSGDIEQLLASLRQCPSYQVDGNHAHCGLRSRLIPLLDVLEAFLQDVGICAECWQGNRAEYAWLEAKRPLTWKRYRFSTRRYQEGGEQLHMARHLDVRDIFTAVDRDWTATDA